MGKEVSVGRFLAAFIFVATFAVAIDSALMWHVKWRLLRFADFPDFPPCEAAAAFGIVIKLNALFLAFIKLLTRSGSLRKLLRFRCVITRRFNVSLYSLFVYYESFSYGLSLVPLAFLLFSLVPVAAFLFCLVFKLACVFVFLLGKHF